MDKLLKFNNKLINSGNNIICKKDTVDPYNPLNLPPNTVRVRTSDGNVPDKTGGALYQTATIVPGTTDVYDVYNSGTSFLYMFMGSTNVIEVLGANTSNVINMDEMFHDCTALQNVPLFDTSNVTSMSNMLCNTDLQTVPLFDTSNVTNMSWMLSRCSHLTSVPLFDTSKVTDMVNTFMGCTNVQSGALALYQQASTQANPPSAHNGTFFWCGKNTQTGAAELAQIPLDWK